MAAVKLLNEQSGSYALARVVEVLLHFQIRFLTNHFKLLLFEVIRIYIDLLLALGDFDLNFFIATCQDKAIAFRHRYPVSAFNSSD